VAKAVEISTDEGQVAMAAAVNASTGEWLAALPK
jgi:hypothetical protein